MTDWKTKTLGELADTQLGKMLNKNKQTGKYSHSYLRSLNVQWGHIELSDLNQMDIHPDEYQKFTLRLGDLLICEGGESGRAAIWNHDIEMGFQNALHRVRAGSEISNKYLLYYFEWLVKNQLIEHLFNGVTIKHFPQENLRSVKISYPPLPEQQKIVEILEDHLSRLDVALADVKQAKEKAAQFRRSLLQAAFTGNFTSDGTRIMTELPAGWVTKNLNSIVDVLDNQRVPINSKERAKRVGSVPYYGATGQVGTIDKAIFNEDLLLLGEDGVQFFDPYKQKAYKISGPAWVNNHAHVLRPKVEEVDLRFLLHYLNQFNYNGYANGTTRLKLTQGSMNSIPVSLPPLPEQQKIVEIVENHLSRLDASIALADSMEKQSASLRRALLQAAFTGQLTKEVASV